MRTQFALAVLLLAACSGPNVFATDNPSYGPAPTTSAVAGVSMKYTSVQLVVGETMQLGATPITLSGKGTGETTVSWVSTAPLVASVDANAVVTALSPGSASIVVTFDGHSGSTAVTVVAASPARR